MAKRKRQSQAWKNAERLAATVMRGKRISRGADFSKEDVDVEVPDIPELRIDAKYRTRHAHHTFMKGIEEKYCSEPEHEPVLVTKHHNQTSAYVTIRLEFFGLLLDALRTAGGENDEVPF